MAYPDEEARGSLRLSLGRMTTEAEIDEAIELVPRVITAARDAAAVLSADPLGQAIDGGVGATRSPAATPASAAGTAGSAG